MNYVSQLKGSGPKISKHKIDIAKGVLIAMAATKTDVRHVDGMTNTSGICGREQIFEMEDADAMVHVLKTIGNGELGRDFAAETVPLKDANRKNARGMRITLADHFIPTLLENFRNGNQLTLDRYA